MMGFASAFSLTLRRTSGYRWNFLGLPIVEGSAHGGIEGMDAIKLAARAEAPRGKKLTCARHIAGYRPEKNEP